MSRYLFILLPLCLAITAHAQKIYYDDQSRQTNKEKYSWQYAQFEKTDSGYSALIYDYNGVLRTRGFYTAIPDDLSKQRHGEFTHYHVNGKISSVQRYVHGLHEGVGKMYSAVTGILLVESNFAHDSVDGPYFNYHFASGKKVVEGHFRNGRQDGVWKHYAEDGSLIDEQTYLPDSIIERKTYEPSLKGNKVLRGQGSKLLSAHVYGSDGKELAYTPVDADSPDHWETAPFAKYSWNQYMASTLKYPELARDNGRMGRVVVHFLLDENGYPLELEIKKSAHPDLDAEAMRVIAEMPAWSPAKINGVPVTCWFELPIIFKIE